MYILRHSIAITTIGALNHFMKNLYNKALLCDARKYTYPTMSENTGTIQSVSVVYPIVFDSYLATTLRQNNIEPMPSIADVRRVITEHCILPLSKTSIFRMLAVIPVHFVRLSGCPRASPAHQITDDNRSQTGGQEDVSPRHLHGDREHPV